MRGAVTWGLRRSVEDPAFPLFPVNGLGSLIPAAPTRDGLAWYAGATYESVDQPPADTALQHQTNLDKLRQLLPETAPSVRATKTSGQLHLWTGTRCVSSDRMPLVGPLESGEKPSLWISSAMGSRGLSFAVLCAELLAARMGAEPWPVEASLARFLQATRRPA
jgi:tRNA 5-methylaminomethyl-2-thiouridine biosynthesis bifunctional protein